MSFDEKSNPNSLLDKYKPGMKIWTVNSYDDAMIEEDTLTEVYFNVAEHYQYFPKSDRMYFPKSDRINPNKDKSGIEKIGWTRIPDSVIPEEYKYFRLVLESEEHCYSPYSVYLSEKDALKKLIEDLDDEITEIKEILEPKVKALERTRDRLWEL
jgi:hypothetical protein